MKTTSFLFTAALCTAPAFAQADECSAATVLPAGPTNAAFDTNVCADTGAAATTSAEQQCGSLSNDIWFQWTATTTGDVVFDTCNTATFDTEIGVWEGSDCATMVGLGCNDDNGAQGCTGLTSWIRVPVTAGQTYYVQVGYWSTSGTVWGAGTLNISDYVDPCIGNIDDSFEDNDTCTTASALTAGTYTGLYLSDVDPDFYAVTIAPGDVMDFDVVDTAVDIDLRLYDASCNLIQDFFTDGLSYSNLSAAPLTVIVECYWDTFNSDPCLNYDATIAMSPDPCFASTDDSFEDNDVCTAPAAVTAGSYLGLFAAASDTDFYSITVPANNILDVFLTDTATGDMDLNLYDSGCGLIQNYNTDGFTYSNTSGAPETIIFECYFDTTSSATCTNYDMDVTLTLDPCFNSSDDSFEDNDVCTAPAAVTAGSYPGLFASGSDSDFYTITIPANNILDVTLLDTATGDMDLNLFDSGCGLILNSLSDGLSYANTSGAPETVVFECYFDTTSSSTCTNYDMDVALSVDPCSVLMADAFEPNADCATATSMSDGTYAGLTVFESDNDYYTVTLADMGTLNVDILFLDADADVDLYLWDPSASCDTNVVGAGGGGGPLDYGFTASDDEFVTFTNTSGADMTIIIEVDMFTAGGCNSYDMIIDGAGPGGPGPIGTTFCPGNPNSTGAVGVTTAFGLASASANDVTLNADNLPVSQFGIFVTSMTAVTAVPVFDGLLCLGGQIGRYTQPSMIWQVDAMGHADLTIDLTMTPQGVGFIPVMPGDTWYYQAWHRDSNMGSATSNFTTGVAVTYN